LFCAEIVENGECKDIHPFEEVSAMLVYKNQFGKNSKQISELFHLSDSAVRNKMRPVQHIYSSTILCLTATRMKIESLSAWRKRDLLLKKSPG